MRSGGPAPEYDAQIVGRHGDALAKREPVPVGERRDLVELAHAPLSIACAQALVKGGVAWRRVAAVLAERAVEIERAVRREQPPGAGHEALRRRPWRDVDHVDRHDGVGLRDRPGGRRGVEHARGQEVRQSGRGPMGRDAGERLGVGIGRLPGQVRHRGREVDGVLAAAARDLQYQPALGQHAPQHCEDRLPIARRRWRGEGAGWE